MGTMCLCLQCVLPQKMSAQVCINEIMPANTAQYMDPTWNFSGWIELYNAGDQDVSLANWKLSDDPENLGLYRFANSLKNVVPAKGYLVVWCDHNDLSPFQTNFKMDCEGGTLYLTDTKGNTETLAFPAQIKGTSYARTSDGGDRWQYCATPTPGEGNAGATFTALRCPAPAFNIEGGLYDGPLQISTRVPAGTTLRYTMDGTEPTENSAISASGQFSINRTTVLRTRLFAANRIPGPTVTNTYIIEDRRFTLPVLSIVTNPDYLWDSKIGIYTNGSNGIPGNGSGSPVNWNQDWARPANVEFIEPEGGKSLFSQECDISISGGWSRGWALKSLDLSAEKKFEGKNRFDYSFFQTKPNIRLKHILLRNSGNDCSTQGGTMMKDALIQSLVGGAIDVEYQAYRPVVHYINGEYYGIINMRERNNKQYVYSNFGYDDEEIDAFEMNPDEGYVQQCGDKTAFNRLKTLSERVINPAFYKSVCNLLDIEEYINYMIVEFYIANWDWPQNNMKGFRKHDDGKFRFTLYDTEGGFNNASENSFTNFVNKNTYTFDSGLRAEIEMVTIFRNLLKNAAFKKHFVDQYCLLTGSVFAPDRVVHIIDSIADGIREEMPYHRSRWGGNFEGGVSALKSFAQQRPAHAISTLKSFMALSDPQEVTLSADHSKAQIFVNDLPLPLDRFSGTLFSPITLRAEAPEGYEFAGWKASSNEVQTIFDYGMQWNYYDRGSLDGQIWYDGYSPADSWSKGTAPLGFAKDGISTTIGYGPDAGNKYPTAYFRSFFILDTAPSAEDQYQLHLTIDDGAVVYINGQEAARYQMPSGAVSFNTYATSHAVSNPDQTVLSLPASLFRKGTNRIAIEVHQNQGTSSDMYLDARLVRAGTSVSEEIYASDPEIALPKGENLQLRATFVKKETPARLASVRINEVSASNSVFATESFKLEDWIELYNTTDEPIDLAGMFLSDDRTNLTKYCIPSDKPELTLLPAYGHRIVWCDKKTGEDYLHASFKLAGEGGQVFLSEGTEGKLLWTDSIVYTPHGGEVSMGRYPDGSDSVYLFNRPSFGKTNTYSVYNESVPQSSGGITDGIESPWNEENATLLAYLPESRELRITLPEGEGSALLPAEIHIYTESGQHLLSETVASGTSATLMLPPLAAGHYIATARLSDGEKLICKFIVAE